MHFGLYDVLISSSENLKPLELIISIPVFSKIE